MDEENTGKRVLVDIFWSSDVFYPHYEEFQPYATIRSARTFIKQMNGETYQKNFDADEVYPLSNGLTQYVHYEPSSTYRKVQLRKDMGLYTGVIVNCRDFFE